MNARQSTRSQSFEDQSFHSAAASPDERPQQQRSSRDMSQSAAPQTEPLVSKRQPKRAPVTTQDESSITMLDKKICFEETRSLAVLTVTISGDRVAARGLLAKMNSLFRREIVPSLYLSQTFRPPCPEPDPCPVCPEEDGDIDHYDVNSE
ncbi:hypothetical protein WME99_20735 [Sorangium sp. So ce136]|uniref:hypothetical protein n=1 Tax=Sorangium sp. So ce136 TaxID=3133284 RepID=UPI003F0E9709